MFTWPLTIQITVVRFIPTGTLKWNNCFLSSSERRQMDFNGFTWMTLLYFTISPNSFLFSLSFCFCSSSAACCKRMIISLSSYKISTCIQLLEQIVIKGNGITFKTPPSTCKHYCTENISTWILLQHNFLNNNHSDPVQWCWVFTTQNKNSVTIYGSHLRCMLFNKISSMKSNSRCFIASWKEKKKGLWSASPCHHFFYLGF